MDDAAREADWSLSEQELPTEWRELGTSMGLVQPRPPHPDQKLTDIAVALRLVLHYAAQCGSQRATTAAAAAAGSVAISQAALHKWMLKLGPYLEALVARMVEPGKYAPERWGGYTLVVADATTVERPGATGTTARIHCWRTAVSTNCFARPSNPASWRSSTRFTGFAQAAPR